MFVGKGTRGSRCYFPDDWKGQYFQSGLGNVIIRKSVITTKGTCVDQHRDYFLFANRFPCSRTFLVDQSVALGTKRVLYDVYEMFGLVYI